MTVPSFDREIEKPSKLSGENIHMIALFSFLMK